MKIVHLLTPNPIRIQGQTSSEKLPFSCKRIKPSYTLVFCHLRVYGDQINHYFKIIILNDF